MAVYTSNINRSDFYTINEFGDVSQFRVDLDSVEQITLNPNFFKDSQGNQHQVVSIRENKTNGVINKTFLFENGEIKVISDVMYNVVPPLDLYQFDDENYKIKSMACCNLGWVFLFENGKIKTYDHNMNNVDLPERLYEEDEEEPAIDIFDPDKEVDADDELEVVAIYQQDFDNRFMIAVILNNGKVRWFELGDEIYEEIVDDEEILMVAFRSPNSIYYLLESGTLFLEIFGEETQETKEFKYNGINGIYSFGSTYIISFENGSITSNRLKITDDIYNSEIEKLEVEYLSYNGRILVILFRNGLVKCFRVDKTLVEVAIPEIKLF